MDMHIHMSYCSFHSFKLLAGNYLQIHGSHRLFPEIETLLTETQVTSAQIAEELMKSEDADVSLNGLVNVLKRKKEDDCFNEDVEEGLFREVKKLKEEVKKKVGIRVTRRKFKKMTR